MTFSCNISIFLQECCHVEMTWICIGPDLRKFDRTVLHFYRTKGLSLKMAVTIIFTGKFTFANAILIVFIRDYKMETLFTESFP